MSDSTYGKRVRARIQRLRKLVVAKNRKIKELENRLLPETGDNSLIPNKPSFEAYENFQGTPREGLPLVKIIDWLLLEKKTAVSSLEEAQAKCDELSNRVDWLNVKLQEKEKDLAVLDQITEEKEGALQKLRDQVTLRRVRIRELEAQQAVRRDRIYELEELLDKQELQFYETQAERDGYRELLDDPSRPTNEELSTMRALTYWLNELFAAEDARDPRQMAATVRYLRTLRDEQPSLFE